MSCPPASRASWTKQLCPRPLKSSSGATDPASRASVMPHSSPLHFVAPSRNQDHNARVDQQERPQGICVNVCKIIPEQSPLSSTERYRPWGSSSWYHPFSLIGEKSFVGFSMSEARLSLVYGSPTGPPDDRPDPVPDDRRPETPGARDPENTRSAHHPLCPRPRSPCARQRMHTTPLLPIAAAITLLRPRCCCQHA